MKSKATKCSELAKKIRRNQEDCCEICGKVCQLHAHHILSVGAYKQMSSFLLNIIVVCPTCHTFGKISFHGNGMDMKNLFDKKYPGKRDELKKIARERLGNVDYDKELSTLKKLDKKTEVC